MDIPAFIEEEKQLSEMFYDEAVCCKEYETLYYDNYILDNPQNETVIDNIVNGTGIQLMVAKPGAGKSKSILKSLEKFVAQDDSHFVVCVFPTRGLGEQMADEDGVYQLLGGDDFDEEARIIASVYEKIQIINELLYREKRKGRKLILFLDEAHMAVTQLGFRTEPIRNLIQDIEQNLFENVIMVTATPGPLTIFQFDKIFQFESTNTTPFIEELQIVETDDVASYIEILDYNKEFPFVRLNDKELINTIIDDNRALGLERLTAEDKGSQLYKDIVDEGKIDSASFRNGILTTNLLEAGISVTEYEDNIVPIFACPNSYISLDDMEQFFNRLRKQAGKTLKCVRVVLPKVKERDYDISLWDMENQKIYDFQDVSVSGKDLLINDTEELCNLSDGAYMIKIGFRTYPLEIRSTGNTADEVFSKDDRKPIVLAGHNFREMLEIQKANYEAVCVFEKKFKNYLAVMEQVRKKEKYDSFPEQVRKRLCLWDEEMLEEWTSCCISKMGELKSCISFENHQLKIDKMMVYMVSYKQYQKQFFYNHDFLKDEMEKRMGTKAVIVQIDTQKGKRKKKDTILSSTEPIWDGLEDLKAQIQDSLRKWYVPDYGEILQQDDKIAALFDYLTSRGIQEEIALQIMINSSEIKEVKEYAKWYEVIAGNNVLNKMKVLDKRVVNTYTRQVKEKLQVAIAYYVLGKKQKTMGITQKNINGILDLYVQFFGENKVPSKHTVKRLMQKMYKVKEVTKDGTIIVGTSLITNVNEIFKKRKPEQAEDGVVPF